MILLVGASASGKTEVAKLLLAKYGIRKVITHTTRTIREGEVNGVDYHFVDKTTFLALKETKFFVETTLYNGNFYGTSFPEIGDDKVLIVDPNGLKAFRALHDSHIITFYMEASPTTRMNRMLYRGDGLEDAKRRIENDDVDFNPLRIGKTDFVIDTETITIEQVADIVYRQYIQIISAIA